MTHKECPKRVLHLSLDISTAGMAFQPGDAVGVCPSNEPWIVDELLSTIAVDGSQCAPVKLPLINTYSCSIPQPGQVLCMGAPVLAQCHDCLRQADCSEPVRSKLLAVSPMRRACAVVWVTWRPVCSVPPGP